MSAETPLEDARPGPRNPVIDPITLEIIGGTIESARREMEIQIERTARSVVIREGRDYRAGIFNRHFENVSSASGAAHVDPILQNYSIDQVEDGDVFIWNDPFKSAGGLTHLPDLCITQPIFWHGDLVAYAQSFGHVTDIGGLTPGSVMIGATSIHQEGLMIPPVKIYSRGRVVEPLYKTIINNSRYPDDVSGDLDAEIMACRIGVARIRELFERFGPEIVETGFEELLERCARALREVALPQIPNGAYPFEDFVEVAGAVPSEPREFIRLKVNMIKSDDRVMFDFTGTDDQSAASINIAGDERFYVKYIASIFRTLVPDTIFNSGAVRVLDCKLPKRSVLSAEYPASASCRAFTLFRLPELCLGALNLALQGQAPASSDTRSVWGIAALNEHGERVFFRDGLGGGGGGRPDVDGSDALNGNVSGRNRPAEFVEAFYPVVVERDAVAIDSGGPGLHRGGLGSHREVWFLAPATLHIIDDRMQLQPWGVAGGGAGDGTHYVLNAGTPDERAFDHKIDAYQIQAGDRLLAKTPGGGGWGDPLTRPPEAVLSDVSLGNVSPAAARRDYGVVVVDDRVDRDATDPERDRLRRTRPAPGFFDRGERFREREAAGRIELTIDPRHHRLEDAPQLGTTP
jgi:N-methylhydantoinase B